MDIVFDILLWVHIIAFIVGGANSVVMPIIGAKMVTATPDTRGTLTSIADQLSMFGKGAMVILLITGPLMLWLQFGWVVPNFWFWVKMALIVVMLVTISLSEINGKKARQGDMEAGRKAGQFGRITALAFLGVLLSAVLAF